MDKSADQLVKSFSSDGLRIKGSTLEINNLIRESELQKLMYLEDNINSQKHTNKNLKTIIKE
jgi:hypothetical protein